MKKSLKFKTICMLVHAFPSLTSDKLKKNFVCGGYQARIWFGTHIILYIPFDSHFHLHYYLNHWHKIKILLIECTYQNVDSYFYQGRGWDGGMP